MKSIPQALKPTEELLLGSVNFELSVVVSHQTKARRHSLNLYTSLWKHIFRLLWISFKEEMFLNIIEYKLCRLISHSSGLIRKMSHLLQKNKGVCRLDSESFLLFAWDSTRVHGVIYFHKTFRDKETITPDIPFLTFVWRYSSECISGLCRLPEILRQERYNLANTVRT